MAASGSPAPSLRRLRRLSGRVLVVAIHDFHGGGSAEPPQGLVALGVASLTLPSDRFPTIERMFVEQPLPASMRTSGSDASEPLENLTLPEVEREICELAAHINAATCRWLNLAAEFDRRGGHEELGFVSCASWLAWKCSLTPRAAREQLRVARGLRRLPRIAAAFRRGTLSYSKVRALTRVAEPEMEEELLELAEEATAAQLERVLRGYRGALHADAASNAHDRRHLATQWEDDGTLSIRGNLPPEEGALLLKALELAREALWSDRAADPSTPGTAGSSPAGDQANQAETPCGRPNRADALVAMAETTVSHGVLAASGGDRQQLVVHVDAAALGSGDATAAASLEEGVGLPVETARRLGCDASIVTLLERDGHPISVGRKTRSVPPSMRRALRSRDGGCRFPGCDRTRFVDAHHIEHWAHGGETSLDNMVQLCRYHHRLVHEGGFSVARERSATVFRGRTGEVIEAVPSLAAGSLQGCVETSRRSGALIDQDTCSPRSAGEAMDLDLAVFALCDREERRRGEALAPT